MSSVNCIIKDQNRNLLRLIIMLLSSKKELQNKNIRKKNILISVSGIDSQKLETARLILYIFNQYCSCEKHELNIGDYLKLTNRELKNRQPLREVVKIARNIEIVYYDNDSKIKREKLFKKCDLSAGVVCFEPGSFFASKLSSRAKNHVEIPMYEFIYWSVDYRHHLRNKIRLIVMFYLCHECSEITNDELEIHFDEFEKQIKELIHDSFDDNRLTFNRWIRETMKDYQRERYTNLKR